MSLTNRQLYDYRDIDRGELKLIRVGHSLWRRLRQVKRGKSDLLSEIGPLERAIEIVVALKREKRVELAIERVERNKMLAVRIRGAR